MNPRPSFVLPLLAVLILLAAFLTPSGRAQDAPDVRFAFSDTTLLRDTLDLKFDLLFPLADSLRMSPVLLRLLAIRYRTPLLRLVHLSDSLRLPVDSVGGVMERERFNPLIASAQRISAFSYNTSYNVSQDDRILWANGIEYVFSVGGIHARNVTNVSIDRSRGELSAITRAAETEANFRHSKALSVGGRIHLLKNESYSSFGRSGASTNEYQLTMRSTHQPRPSLRTGLNAFMGPFSSPESEGSAVKRGISSQLNGNLQYSHKGWLIYNLDGRVTGRFGRGRLPERPWLDIRETFGTVNGTLSLYERTPVSVRLSHGLTRNEAQNPDTTMLPTSTGSDTTYFLRRLPTGTRTVTLALDLRNDHGSFTVNGDYNNSDRLLKVGRVNRSATSRSMSFGASGRYLLGGWNLDGRFNADAPISEDPLTVTRTFIEGGDTALVHIDYRQKTESRSRSLDLSVDRALSQKLSVRARGRLYLSAPRSSIIDSSYRARPEVPPSFRLSPTEPADSYEDGFEIRGIYVPSVRLSTSLALELSTRENIALLAVSSSRNTRVRSYRAQWSWTYRLMEGLTATQRNSLTADYTYYPFDSLLNALSMRFDINTTLNANVTPRLRIDLTHISQEQPRGTYVEADGKALFRVTSRTRNYNLASTISYSPFSTMSLTLSPSYRADGSGGDAGLRKSFDFSGGASVNYTVGRRGTLSGNMARTYNVRSASSGESRSPERYSWSGALSFSWSMQ